MIRMAVLHVNTAKIDSTSPTMRIARFAAEQLEIPLAHDVESAKKILQTGRPDVLFVKHGLLRFSEHREEALALYASAGKIVNLENDCMFERDVRFRKIYPTEIMWSTVPSRLLKPVDSYINWNVLTWHPPSQWREPLPFSTPAVTNRILYYGAYKEIRAASFKKFFSGALGVDVSSYRGGQRFTPYGQNVRMISGKLRKIIKAYASTLYIEDDYSHETYSSPANRFYESLQEGLAIIFDEACHSTFNKAGIGIKQYSASTPEEVVAKMKHWQDIRQEQRDHWLRDYSLELREQIKSARVKLIRHVAGGL